MMLVAFARTLAIAVPIDPVVSDKKTMSGFDGIAGVSTVFVIVTLEPDCSTALNEDGVTPAETGAARNSDVSAADATPTPRICFFIRFAFLSLVIATTFLRFATRIKPVR